MRRIWKHFAIRLPLVALISLFSVSLMIACRQQPEVKAIDVDDLPQVLANESPVVVDVRSPEAFALGHLPGAINNPLNSTDFEQKLSDIDKNKAVVVYCAAGSRGSRSDRAAELMNQKGYERVFLLRGGYRKYKGTED